MLKSRQTNLVMFIFCITMAILACTIESPPLATPQEAITRMDDPTDETEDVSTKDVPAMVESLQQNGEIPFLDRDGSLQGSDANSDGIRDDIASYISSLEITDTQMAALRELARSLQSTQLVDVNDTEAVLELQSQLTVSVLCMSAEFSDQSRAHAFLTTLEGYTANTPERAQQYDDFNGSLDGTVMRLPDELECQ